ncbi:WxL protein peptidoglycan domain-containing protein [Enterococcus faecalis]
MINFKKIVKAMFIALLLIIFIMTKSVNAESNNNVGYSVYPEYSDNQNKNSSFFDLLVIPGTEQKIGVTINNTSTETSNYNINVI